MTDTHLPQNPNDSDESRYGDLIRDLRALPRIDAPPDFGMRLHARIATPRPRISRWQDFLLWLRSSPRRVPVIALSAAGMVCVAVIGTVLYRSMERDVMPASEGAGTVSVRSAPAESFFNPSTEPSAGASVHDDRTSPQEAQDTRRRGRVARPPAAAPVPAREENLRMETQRGLQDAAPAPQKAVPGKDIQIDAGALREHEGRGVTGTGAADTLRAKSTLLDTTRRDSTRRDSMRRDSMRRDNPQRGNMRRADSARPR